MPIPILCVDNGGVGGRFGRISTPTLLSTVYWNPIDGHAHDSKSQGLSGGISLDRVEEDVRSGAGLGLSLEKTGQFPTLLHQLVAVGEESGRTADILLKSAVTFDTQVRNQMSSLVAALQPALIIFLAIAVGGITITMLSAVFSMNAVEF